MEVVRWLHIDTRIVLPRFVSGILSNSAVTGCYKGSVMNEWLWIISGMVPSGGGGGRRGRRPKYSEKSLS